GGRGAVGGMKRGIATVACGAGQSGSIGLGFAIPINEARDIAQQIIRSGSVKHATLAVNARSVTQLNGNRDGALIEAVQPGGAGDAAGLHENDVITKVDGTLITGADKLTVAIRAHRVGDKVKITFVRGSQTRTTERGRAARPARARRGAEPGHSDSRGGSQTGITEATLQAD